MTEEEAKQWVKDKTNQDKVATEFFKQHKTSKTKTAFFMAGFDYRGPCPMGATHTYQFEVTAVPMATLNLGPNPTTEQIRTVLQNVGIGHGDVMATSNAAPPPADAGGQ